MNVDIARIAQEAEVVARECSSLGECAELLTDF
jgi:hypothetical protein